MSGLDCILYRHHEAGEATWGVMYGPCWHFYSMELPGRNNEINRSCVNPGTYPVVWNLSPHFEREMYLLLNTEPRSGIRIHSASVPQDLLGCIALGIDIWHESPVLLHSRTAVRQFERTVMATRPFTLNIVQEQPPCAPMVAVETLERSMERHCGTRYDVGPPSPT